MRVRYGTDIATVANSVEGVELSTDPSLDVLLAIAVAYKAVLKMEELGVDLEFSGRELIKQHLEKAYREAAHVRKGIEEDWLDVSKITKFGRLVSND